MRISDIFRTESELKKCPGTTPNFFASFNSTHGIGLIGWLSACRKKMVTHMIGEFHWRRRVIHELLAEPNPTHREFTNPTPKFTLLKTCRFPDQRPDTKMAKTAGFSKFGRGPSSTELHCLRRVKLLSRVWACRTC